MKQVEYFIIILVMTVPTQCELISDHYKAKHSCGSGTQTPFTARYVRSKIECAAKCRVDVRCVSAEHTKLLDGRVRCDFMDGLEESLDNLVCGGNRTFICEFTFWLYVVIPSIECTCMTVLYCTIDTKDGLKTPPYCVMYHF